MSASGKVYFVGAGPGDPRLLSTRAMEVLSRCHAIVYDEAISEGIFALKTPECQRIEVAPAGSDSDSDPAAGAVASKLLELARAGKHVVRLFPGDALLFTNADEEISAVRRAPIALEIIPGIPVAVAVAAYAGVPLTLGRDRSPSLAFVNLRGPAAEHDWSGVAVATDALVILAEASAVTEIAAALVRGGRLPSTPAAVVQNASLPSQQTMVGALADMGPRARLLDRQRVTFVVGEGVERRESLRWFDVLPLFGKRILVTRAREQATRAASLLRERGAEPVVVPTLEFHPPPDRERVQTTLARLRTDYDWVAFTSANGVGWTWKAIAEIGGDARAFGSVRIAAIGPETARALETHGLRADLIAKEFKGEGLAEEMLRVIRAPHISERARVLIARADKARDALPDLLRAGGCEVDVLAVYETKSPPDAHMGSLVHDLERRRLDAVLFTSSSTVEHLCNMLGEHTPTLLGETPIFSIGPITTATAEKCGLHVEATAKTYTLLGLIETLEASFTLKTAENG